MQMESFWLTCLMLIRWCRGIAGIRRRLPRWALAKELSLHIPRLALVALLALAVPPYANAQMSTGTAFSVVGCCQGANELGIAIPN